MKLVFMDNVPKGFIAGKDYVSSVSADNYGNGVAAAHLMAKALGGKGEIGLVFHAADFFVTRQRYDGFKKTIAGELSGHQDRRRAGHRRTRLLRRRGKGGRRDADRASQHQGHLGGLGRARRRRDLGGARRRPRRSHHHQRDLGENVAIAMAKGEFIKGLACAAPLRPGRHRGELAGYGLIGKPAPAYVALPAAPVTKATC